jgi:hypothetical protein
MASRISDPGEAGVSSTLARRHGVEFDLAARRPVWAALSNLFLDTDVSLLREENARVLAASRYSIEELQRILVNEVYPVCRTNLVAWPGGEWVGFDEAWLEERIVSRPQSRAQSLKWLNLGRLTVYGSWEWRCLKKRISELRSRATVDGAR